MLLVSDCIGSPHRTESKTHLPEVTFPPEWPRVAGDPKVNESYAGGILDKYIPEGYIVVRYTPLPTQQKGCEETASVEKRICKCTASLGTSRDNK
jgi:hypothetical protein